MKHIPGTLLGLSIVVLLPMGVVSAKTADQDHGMNPVDAVQTTPAADQATPVLAEVQRLKELKEKDPEAFHHAIQERRAQLKEKLAHLKETDPAAFQQMKERLREQRRERLEYLKAHDPERFKELMAQHRQHLQERLEELKKRDPQRYEQVMQRRQEWQENRQQAERLRQEHPNDWWTQLPPEQLAKYPLTPKELQQLSQTNPQAARAYLEAHPRYGERLQHWKDKAGEDRGANHDGMSPGVRDHGDGVGRGQGQGGAHRSPNAHPGGGSAR